MIDKEKHLKEWNDLASGLSLIYLGPDGENDWLTNRVLKAIENKDLEELDHCTSLLQAQLQVAGVEVPQFAKDTWSRLDKEYHANFCEECQRNRQ